MNRDEVIEHGAQAAMMVLHVTKQHVESLGDEARVQWWAGFLGAMFGAARGSIGGEATRILAECLPPLADEALHRAKN